MMIGVGGLTFACSRCALVGHPRHSSPVPNHISRRTFIAHVGLLGAYHPVMRRGFYSAPALRVGVIGLPRTPTDARAMGLTLGAEEAAHAAALFGGSFSLVALRNDDVRAGGLAAIIGDGDCRRTRNVAAAAASAGLPFVNVGCGDDALRGAQCQRTTLHIAPSDAMRRDAQAAARVTSEVIVWHPALVRFGADTLNRRFRERFGTPMVAEAWSAWLATKILWESSLRLGSAEPAAILQHFTRDTTQFDGHKGLPLSFRPWDRQLRQPLYLLEGKRVIEVPVASKPGEPARDLLDQLGANAGNSLCHGKA
jgi:hypothetical protein